MTDRDRDTAFARVQADPSFAALFAVMADPTRPKN